MTRTRTRTRCLTALGAVVLGAGLLTGCGGDDEAGASGDYCTDLEAVSNELNSVQDGDVSSLEETLDSLEVLRDEAPAAIEEDWDRLYDAFERIVQAFDDAGLSAEDIEDIQNGQIPDGVDQQALEQAYAEISRLSDDTELTASVTRIQDHAKDECDLDLS